MIAFRVQLNGGEPVTAGAAGDDTLSVVAISAVRDRRHHPEDEPLVDLKLHVTGLRRTADGAQGTFEWLDCALSVGDEAVIRVVDVDEADLSPVRRERAMAEMTEEAERYELACLLRKYGAP
jgi:hypothetical protein